MPLVELGDICEFLDHKRKPVSEELRRRGLFPYYGANGQQGWIDDYIFDEPLVLLAEDGGHFGSRTSPIAYRISGKTWVNNHAHVLRPLAGCDISYLAHALSFYDVTKLITGTTRPKLTKGNAETIRIPLPSLSEQHQVARQLERADRLRRTRRYARALTDNFLPSVFLNMFEGYFETDMPKTRLGDLVTITGGGTPSREVSAYFTGLIPWLTSKDMKGDYIWDTQEHVTDEAIAKSATKLVPSNSILVVVKSKVLMHRLPLAISRVPLCHGQDIKSIQCSDRLCPEFARYVLKYYEPNLLHIARGANTEGLTLPMLEGLLVPDVELLLQQDFSQIVRRFERIRAQEREAERQAEHLFQTFLHRAFANDV